MEACKDRPDRSELVRLFLTKAGQTIHDRIYIEGIQTNADVFYEMTYQALLINLQSAGYQLHASDELPGIYFLRGSNKAWDETPFEFAEIIAKKFAGLAELPLTRKKETVQKYALPTPKEISAAKTVGKKKLPEKTKSKVVAPVSKQPALHLKKPIEFTNLERLVFTQANLNKRDVLNYYDKVTDYLLPWLKDRVMWVRQQSDTPTESTLLNKNSWTVDTHVLPNWIQQRDVANQTCLLCNDRDHLFFYLERSYLEFSTGLSHLKSLHTPDYMVLAIDSPGSDLSPTCNVALVIREVLTGLHLPSFVKTDGHAGFHIYIPLDGKSDFKKSGLMAEYICKLVRLKIPDLVTLNAADEMTYGKVSLNYSLNADGQSVTAPYSIVQGSQPTVATPLLWDEIQHDLRMEDFTSNSVLKRLDKTGDPFETFFKKKVNAEELLERLHDHYAFLL